MSDSERKRGSGFLLVVGLLAVVLGLLCNSWLTAPQLSADGNASRASHFMVWLAGTALLLGGLLLIRNRHRIPVARVVLVLVTTAVALGGAELILKLRPLPSSADLMDRKIHYAPSAYSMHRLASFDHDVLDGPLDKPHVRARVRDGYRGDAFPRRKPDGEVRIFIMGGSFVFDFNAGEGRHWPKLVQEHLRKAGHSNVRVVNAGVPGHATFDSLGRFMSEVQLLEPDFVVLCHTWNDLKYFRTTSAETPPLRTLRGLSASTHPGPRPGLMRFLEGFQLYRRLQQFRSSLGTDVGIEGALPTGEPDDAFQPKAVTTFRLNIQTFVDACRNAGCVPVICTQPRLTRRDLPDSRRKKIEYRYVLLTHKALCDAYDACDAAIRGIARDKKVHLIDLEPQIASTAENFSDQVHVTPVGSERVAAATAKGLEPLLSGS